MRHYDGDVARIEASLGIPPEVLQERAEGDGTRRAENNSLHSVA
jgi:hypothetical protein